MKRLSRHHEEWLKAHPYVDQDWLARAIDDGFHIHHVDGNRLNNTADNLLLIFGPDHSRLHRLERRAAKIAAKLGIV